MPDKRQIEIFSAGCSLCQEAIETVQGLVCESCEVAVLDMNQREIAAKAYRLGVRSVPAVTIEGKLAGCCAGRDIDVELLRAEGLGQLL